MVFCGNIAVKSYSDTKIFLKGTVTGLDSSKEYCLYYVDWGDKNLPNSSLSYTYLKNRTSYDLAAHGCYLPHESWMDDEQFEVRCNEIGVNCEDIIKNVCGQVLKLEIHQDQYVYYVVEDQDGRGVSNARIECAGDTLYTDSSGEAHHILQEKDTEYYATCYPPGGYTCVDCNESFIVDGTEVIDFKLKKDAVQCLVDVCVEDQEGTGVAGAVVTIPGAEGADDITTDYWGVAGGFTLIEGKAYTASVKSLPDAWETTGQSSKTITPTGNTSYKLYVNKKVTHVCDDGEKRYPTTCDDGSVIHQEICEDNRWVPTGESCPDLCAIDFMVFDLNHNPIPGVVCSLNGQSDTTDSLGACTIAVACGQSYTGTCVAPDGYICDAAGCVCSDGPFTPTADGFVDTFFLKKLGVVCDDGDERKFEECADGSIKAKEICVGNEWVPNPDSCTEYPEYVTITKCDYPESLPPGEEIVIDVEITNSSIQERKVKAQLIDDDTNDKIDVDPYEGAVFKTIAGETAWSLQLGTEGPFSLDYIDMPEHDAHLRIDVVNDADTIVASTGRFVIVACPFDLKVPTIVMAGDVTFKGKAPANTPVLLRVENTWLGLDALAKDETIANTTSDADGGYKGTVKLDEFSYIKVYALIEKGGALGFLLDKKTSTHAICVLTPTVIIAGAILVALLYDKQVKGKFIGVFKKR